MSTTISSFPFIADKITDLPAVTSLAGSDKVVVNASGVTSSITKTAFVTDLDFQPHDPTLDTLAGLSLSLIGQALLVLPTPDPALNVYMKVNEFNSVSYLSPGAVRADISAQPLNSNLNIYSNITPSDSGRGILRVLPPEGAPGYIRSDTVVDGYSVATARSYAQVRSDIGAFATASLDNDATLGGALANPGKAPSQQAVKKYVDSRVGTTLDPTLNDDTIASAATLALDATSGSQLRVTGTTPVTAVTLAEKDTRTLVFDGAVLFTASPTLTLPGGVTTLTTAAGGYANVTGGAVGVVSLDAYFPPQFAIHYGGDFYTAESFSALGEVDLGGNFTTDSVVQFVQPAESILTITSTASTSATLPPGTHTLASEVGNYSFTSQAPAASTRTYISGSAITIPDTKMKIGSKFLWKFNLTKTAAGTASSTIDICVGTTGTTSDTTRLSFTKPGGSAAADEGFCIVEAICRGPLSASGIMVGEFVMYHNLASTGHMIIPVACVNTVSSTFDVTTTNLIIGLCITTGASDAVTVQQVTAQAFNI